MNALTSILNYLEGKKTYIGAGLGLLGNILNALGFLPGVAADLISAATYITGTGVVDKLLRSILGNGIAGAVEAIAGVLGGGSSTPPPSVPVVAPVAPVKAS